MIYFTKSVDRDTPLHLAGHMIAVSSVLQNRNKLGQIYTTLACVASAFFLLLLQIDRADSFQGIYCRARAL